MEPTEQMHRAIELARQQRNVTRRATCPALDERLYQAIPCLDHGFVRVIDYMGDDRAVVQAARVSYGAGTRKLRRDRALIRYLVRHRHTTPFEMCEIKLHVKLPIFVARQWIRHRTASVNELSARYSVLDREFYLPAPGDLASQSSTNRQGRGAPLPPERSSAVIEILRRDAELCFDHYERLIDHHDLARELARIDLTLGTYTQWYWKIDLHNLLHFLALRLDPHAQREIRVYAGVIAELVRCWVPLTWEAFEDYRIHGAAISRQGLDVLRRRLAGLDVDQESSGLSPREWRDLSELFPLAPTSPPASPGPRDPR